MRRNRNQSTIMRAFVLFAAVLVLLAFGASGARGEPARFDNYKVYSLSISNDRQLVGLRTLEEQQRFQFWYLPHRLGNASIVVAPHQAAEFGDLVDALQLDATLAVPNVQRLIDNENPSSGNNNNGTSRSTAFNWTRYHTIDEIYAWLNGRLAAFPALLTNIPIGQTSEGRQLRVVRLSAKAGNPAIFVEANIHAREWITSATATWLLNELLTSTEPEVRELATNIDWYFLVVANPDGFAFTHTSNRMWRKTRSASGSVCRGVDANRNFEFHWNQGGASSNPCSDTFAGARAFSEPETRAIRDFYASIARRTRLFVSLHAFGQYVLLPFGHVTSPSANHANLMSVGNAGVAAIRRRFNTGYIIGSVANVMYVATGSSADWAFGVHRTPLTYTFELRDVRQGPHGFLLPANQIIPNNLEFFDGLRAMIRQARSLNQI